MKDSRRLWPSRAINLNGLMRELGYVSQGTSYRSINSTYSGLRCPACGSGIAYTESLSCGPTICWFKCAHCKARMDPMMFASAHWKCEISEAVRKIESLKLFTSKRAVSHEVLTAYYAYVRSRKAFDKLADAMKERAVESVTGSDVHMRLGINEMNAHEGKAYWTTTVGELDSYLHNRISISGSIPAILESSESTLVVAVPAYVSCDEMDRGLRVVGVWAASRVNGRGDVLWRYLPAVGESGGISAMRKQSSHFEQLTFDTNRLKLMFDTLRNGGNVQLEVCGGLIDAEFLKYLEVSTNSNYDFHLINEPDMDNSDGSLYVASRISSLVYYKGNISPWQRVLLEKAVEANNTQLPLSEYGFYPSDVGWNKIKADEAIGCGILTSSQVSQINTAIRRVDKAEKPTLVPIRRGFTIHITETGWVWYERNILVLSVVPHITRVYRDEHKRTCYMGHLMYGHNILPFSGRNFRKNASAMIETVCVRYHYAPPFIHPIVVPHIASIAMYLRTNV